MHNLKGPFFLLFSCLLFSVTGTLQQLAPEGHTPVVITEVRMLLGSLTILAWCLFTHRLPSNWSVVPWKPMVIAVASVLLYQLLFFYSVAEVGVAVGSVVAIATTPLWAAAVAFLLFRKKPSKFWAIATALAIVPNFRLEGLASGCCRSLLRSRNNRGREGSGENQSRNDNAPRNGSRGDIAVAGDILLSFGMDFYNKRNSGFSWFRCGDGWDRLSLLYLWHQVHLTCSSFHISVDRAAHGCRTWNFLSSRKPHHTHGFRHVEPDCICHRLNFRWTREILFVKRGE